MSPEDILKRDLMLKQIQASQDLAFQEVPQMFIPARYVAPESGVVGYVDASNDRDNYRFNNEIVIPELIKEFTPDEYKNRTFDNILNPPENRIITDPRDEKKIINPKRMS